ncbi:MAG TPA: tRNA uridine-5-carboxymethylaminomethyl(34) synthesis GTPase MnmE [Bacillota bacterium]|nr:tRNA uridine-5-carboxymethylaminomethyl(34) synthesis GTPase MnmE [Bacillota bacterium]
METIAAVSTPAGKGGIAVIRISGDGAFALADRIFFPASGKKPGEYPRRYAIYGKIALGGEEIDDGLITLFAAGRSFTGEDTAEISCHGGMYVTSRVLEAVLACGARPAQAGEFTRRAFMNGVLTLSQAEATGGIIDAKTQVHLSVAHAQLGGALTKTIDAMSSELRNIAASVYAYIDYPDEDMTDLSIEEMRTRLTKCREKADRMLGGRKYMKAVSEGVRCAIIGKPNTGKSSLLNALAGYDRAIVTDIEGTTRDVVTEQVTVGSVLLLLSDTAGLRESFDPVEKVGIEHTKRNIASAELLLAVFDASEKPDALDEEVISLISEKRACCIAVLNKSDKKARYAGEYSSRFENSVIVSTKTLEGFDKLAHMIGEICGENEFGGADEIMLSARQNAALIRARDAINDALVTLDSFTQDIAVSDIESALGALGEIDSRSVSEDIVNEIFSKFCVGK